MEPIPLLGREKKQWIVLRKMAGLPKESEAVARFFFLSVTVEPKEKGGEHL